MVVETLIAFGWAVAVAFGVLLASTRLLGNDRGLNAARGVGGALSIGGMLAIKWLVKHVPAGGGWLLLAVSAALVLTVLPVLTAGVAQRILIGEAAPVAPEPSWGSPSHWRRLRRTPAWAGIVGAVPAVIIAVTSPPSIRAIAIGLFVVLIAAVPVKSLLQPEFDVPLRLELAPERRRYLVRLYCTVGGPSWAVAMLLLALFGWRHPVWMAACAGLVVAAPLVYLVRRFAIRRILQTATIAATFAACLLY